MNSESYPVALKQPYGLFLTKIFREFGSAASTMRRRSCHDKMASKTNSHPLNTNRRGIELNISFHALFVIEHSERPFYVLMTSVAR